MRINWHHEAQLAAVRVRSYSTPLAEDDSPTNGSLLPSELPIDASPSVTAMAKNGFESGCDEDACTVVEPLLCSVEDVGDGHG
jgi:hypothetical protein